MPPSHTRKRPASPLIQDEGPGASFNARTGRPVRKARRSQENSPFVDSADIISDTTDSESSEAISVSRRRKRKRSPSPPMESSDDDAVNERTSSPVRTLPSSTNSGTQITLRNVVVNVPVGHQGPVLLQLDLPSLSNQPDQVKQKPSKPIHSPLPPSDDSIKTEKPAFTSSSGTSEYAGFLDLPAELRNDIYQRVFIADSSIRFDSPTNFNCSATLLRTCKQVYEEGRSILYSANHFIFARRTSRMGSYWELEWNELGFKAARKFLKIIGPANIGLIRHATLLLRDATPCLNPDMRTADERRFVHDDILMSIMRQLTDHGRLQKLEMHFDGRRRVEHSDHRFLEYLTEIQADEVAFVRTPGGHYQQDSKQESIVEKLCLRAMQRKTKLYN